MLKISNFNAWGLRERGKMKFSLGVGKGNLPKHRRLISYQYRSAESKCTEEPFAVAWIFSRSQKNIFFSKWKFFFQRFFPFCDIIDAILPWGHGSFTEPLKRYWIYYSLWIVKSKMYFNQFIISIFGKFYFVAWKWIWIQIDSLTAHLSRLPL